MPTVTDAVITSLLYALERMVEEAPYESSIDSCECGENGTGFDDDGKPCEHVQARRAIEKAHQYLLS